HPHQGLLVESGPATDIDDDAVGPERAQHVLVHDAFGGGTAGQGHEQEVRLPREFDQGAAILVGHPRSGPPIMIADGATEALEPPRDLAADTAETGNAVVPAAEAAPH